MKITNRQAAISAGISFCLFNFVSMVIRGTIKDGFIIALLATILAVLMKFLINMLPFLLAYKVIGYDLKVWVSYIISIAWYMLIIIMGISMGLSEWSDYDLVELIRMVLWVHVGVYILSGDGDREKKIKIKKKAVPQPQKSMTLRESVEQQLREGGTMEKIEKEAQLNGLKKKFRENVLRYSQLKEKNEEMSSGKIDEKYQNGEISEEEYNNIFFAWCNDKDEMKEIAAETMKLKKQIEELEQ